MDKTDITNQVLIRLGASTSLGFYTDSMLTDWFVLAHKWACGYKKWAYTEGKETTTYSSSTEEYQYPETWRPDGIRLLQVGGKRCQKLNFEDYQRFREDRPDADDKIFTDYMDRYFINPSSGLSGTITVWGQYTPYVDKTNEDYTTVFSNTQEDGNEAIIQRMLAYAMEKEKKFQESMAYYAKAKELLDRIWQDYKDEQFGYQTKNRGMWADFDVLQGGINNNEDQFGII